jgi:hypothetical protein
MYIYDPQLRASNVLGAENGVLHGLGKRPEVVLLDPPKEVERLTGEMVKLVQRNVWPGVERTYKLLEDISKRMGDEVFDLLPEAGKIHFWGAEAARMLGWTLLSQTRLLRGARLMANRVGMADEPWRRKIVDSLDAIEKTYGAVKIEPQPEPTSKKERKRLQGRGPALMPVVWPLAPDLRKSIEAAAQVLKEKGEFKGLLPAGDYKYTLTLEDGSVTPPFTVDAGTEYKGKGPKKVPWVN